VFFINDWGRKCTYVMRPRWNGALLQSDTGDEPLEIFADANGSLFKPSDIEVGPDGALWILGWGNGYGVEWKGEPKLENQINEGRIFRVWHHDNHPDKRTAWLTAKRRKPINKWKLTALLDDLTHAIPAWRTDAQDELLRRASPQMSDTLIRLAKAAKTPAEETWLTWTLALHQAKAPGQNTKADQALLRLATGAGSLNQQEQALRAIRLRLAKAEEKTDMTAALGQALGHRNARIRFAALQTIRQTKLNQFAPWIVRLAATETDRITFYAAWGGMRELLPTDELRPLLGDQRAGVRRAALLALLESQFVTPAEARPLLNDPDPGVATVAALYLSKVERDLANLLQVSPNGGEFFSSQTISIRANIKDTHVRYTLDGSEPNGRSPVYRDPFTIDESVRLRAAMFRDEEQVGPLVKLNFYKIDLSGVPANVVKLDSDSTQRTVRIAGGLHEGGRVYLDRQYRFTSIPDLLKGAAYLMSRNDDAGSRGESIVTLKASCLVDIYIAHDRRIAAAAKPDWLQHFAPSELEIHTSDARTDLFHRRFKDGETIVLGGNTADGTDSGKSNYVAVFGQVLMDPQPKPVTQKEVLAALDEADANRGRQIFFGKQGPQCSTCHEVDGAGKNFGPELSGIGSRENPATILQSILQPNTRLVEGYRTHIVEMKDGKTYAGMALEESGLTFKLGLAAGQSVALDKKQIVNRTSADTSPMPPNFGVLMNAQQLADLTAYLASRKDEVRTTAKPPEAGVRFEASEGQVAILINGQIVGTYVHDDPVTLRPFFKNIRTLSGIQVTRNHPPIESVDAGDHASMHPGIWMAFGDISGSDFWRNRARVVHERFITQPSGGKSSGSFSVSNRFETNDSKLICRQTVTHTIHFTKGNWQLTYDCAFTAPHDFYLGDQEEMGLGVRLATPLIEKNGGQLRNSAQQVGAKATWGQPATWCDYSGEIEGKWAGITIMTNNKTPRVPWWHNRNYGLMLANQFGRDAMHQGEKSKTHVKADSTLQLSFTVIIHEHENVKLADRAGILEALTR
jgi:putative heme-binding domain-containing protein